MPDTPKILVVEDDKFLANALRVKLTKSGYDTQLAFNGEESLNILSSFAPNLIIMDLVMPIKDGFAAIEEIKKNKNWKDIPIIVTSNLGQKEDIERAKALGALDYFVKTDLSLDDLIVRIKNILKE